MTPERELYARDRRQLLARWARRHGTEVPSRPVRAIVGVLEMQGYKVVDGPLPDDRIGWTDFARGKVVICENLAEKLAYKHADINGVRHSTLGHELGHVQGIEDCDDCNVYAACFLVPYRQLQSHTVMQKLREAKTQKQVWRRVFELARDFGVTATLMRRALCEFGWCEYDAESRELRLSRTLHQEQSCGC